MNKSKVLDLNKIVVLGLSESKILGLAERVILGLTICFIWMMKSGTLNLIEIEHWTGRIVPMAESEVLGLIIKRKILNFTEDY